MVVGDNLIHSIVEKYSIYIPIQPEFTEVVRRESYELFCEDRYFDEEFRYKFEPSQLPLCVTKGVEDDIIIHLVHCTHDE